MSVLARPITALLGLAASLFAATLAPPALACGGLFCDSSAPVNQAAERIIFAKNDDGTVSAVIEILYEGPAPKFAWVLPVPPGETEVGVSSKNALDQLDLQSNPTYQLNSNFGDCALNRAEAVQAAAGPLADDELAEKSGISVVAEGNAGPYTYTQIMADPALKDPASAALDWLEENGYEVGKLAPDLLGEYLSDGMNLLAFKLQKGKNSGSVRPVFLRYEGERPVIPIRPTAVAANDDMGVKVWVLGDSRAISSNYPDLVLNEALIDWFNPNNTYNDVVIAAANETEKGQGFVTEQSGPAGAFAQNVYPSWQADAWDQLRTARFDSKQAFLEGARERFSDFDGFSDVMLDPALIPLRDGATHEQLLTCISCYFEEDVPVRNEAYPTTPYLGKEDPIHTLDIMAFLDTFDELVISPLEKTRALFDDHAMVTRFYTTLSADEMTVDPEFDFNAELPDVSNVHTATQSLSCDGNNEWTVNLPQGMTIRGTGRTWPVTLEEESIPVNLRVVQLRKEGEGDMIQDNAGQIANLLNLLNLGAAEPELLARAGADSDGSDDQFAAGGGCSTQAPRGSFSAFLVALGLVLPRLRRKRVRRTLNVS